MSPFKRLSNLNITKKIDKENTAFNLIVCFTQVKALTLSETSSDAMTLFFLLTDVQ